MGVMLKGRLVQLIVVPSPLAMRWTPCCRQISDASCLALLQQNQRCESCFVLIAGLAQRADRAFCLSNHERYLWLRKPCSRVIVGIMAFFLQPHKCIAKSHDLIRETQLLTAFTGTPGKAVLKRAVDLPPSRVITPEACADQAICAGLSQGVKQGVVSRAQSTLEVRLPWLHGIRLGQLSRCNDQLLSHGLPAPQSLLFGKVNPHMAKALFTRSLQLLCQAEGNIGELLGVEWLF